MARAWGADVEFSDATIVNTSLEATDLHRVIVDVGADVAKGYTKGGQFLQMKVGDSKPAFLAIANAPDPNNAGGLEFLIKDIPNSTANLIVNLSAGDKVAVSPVMGKGFPMEKVPAADFDTMLIFATGSGISPIKALIEAGALDAQSRKDVRLYYGATSEERMAYMDRIPEWEAAGVKVIKVLSGEGEFYVQQIYEKDTPPADGSRACVLLCGQKEMCEGVKAVVTTQGISEENCLTNF